MAALSLQLQTVQQFMAQKATDFLAKKLKTHVSIGRFTTDWGNSIVLKEFYLEDQKKDTLIYAERFGVDINLVALLQNKIKMRGARIDNGFVEIKGHMPDSVYNFDFILSDFPGKKRAADTVAAFTFTIKSVRLNNIRF